MAVVSALTLLTATYYQPPGAGQMLDPIGQWMGFDWRLTVALIPASRRENAIATLGVLGNSPADGGGLAQTLAATSR
jgi:hypothetical protein